MNRKLKFRAWDKENEKMFNNIHAINFKGTKVYVDYRRKCFYLDFKECVLMQFTGLKDKNKKEIYEGDVVELDCGDKRRYIVEYIIDDGMSRCGFYLRRIIDDEIHDFGSFNVKIIVVGSIYKNPELLKEAK